MAYRGGRPQFTSFRNRKPRFNDEDRQMSHGEGSGNGRGGRRPGFREHFDHDRGSGKSDWRGGRGKHPPHLRGKAIGLFYARQNSQKMKEESKNMEGGIKINLDQSREKQIKSLLSVISLERTENSSSCHAAVSSKSSPEIMATVVPKQDIDLNPECSSVLSACGSREASMLCETSSASKSCLEGDKSFGDKEENLKAYSNISDSVFKRNFIRSITETLDCKIDRLLQSHTAFQQNPHTDQWLKNTLSQKKTSSKVYKAMYEFRKKLPSFKMQEQILDLINKNQVVVISGETGCGKTTQVAQFILDDYILSGKGSLCRVICTQPRRISATSVAERVAAERDEELGSVSVGYQIRLDKKVAPKQGSILYCTTGILLQWMQLDPALSETSHIVLDEIHERDTVSDFVITLLKDILPKRPDLKIILMSATLNAHHFSRYFNSCPSINIPGFAFPVEELYLEDVLEITRFQFHTRNKRMYTSKEQRREYEEFIEPHVRNLQRGKKYSRQTIQALQNPESEELNMDLVAELVKHICISKPDGAILVFLPGWEQISNLNKLITSDSIALFLPPARYLIIPLHSMMPTTVQRSVFDRPAPGVRKIIIATNIAETSITIDDVVYVVDCGKIKIKNYDPVKNVQTLKPEWVSIANARQRRGRAGRVQPGVCYHLFSRAREMTLASYPLPEMMRSRLDEVILTAKILQLGQIRGFLSRVMDPPDPLAIDHSLKLLSLINALDENENLTPLGYHLAKLPVDPQTGKMLLMGALFSCVNPVFSVAASLNFKDPFMTPLGKEKEVDRKKVELSNGSKSDHLLLGDALMQWEEEDKRGNGSQFCRYFFLSQGTLHMLKELKKQFAQTLYDMKFLESSNPASALSNINSSNRSLVKAIICAGLYPNVAYLQHRKATKRYTTPQDGRVHLHPKCVNDKEKFFESPFFVYHLKLKNLKNIVLHDTTMVYPLQLLFFGESVKFFKDRFETVSVGKYLRFRCKESTAKIVMELREHMNALLEYRACHPGTIKWQNSHDLHVALLSAIVELITYEDTGLSSQIECLDSDGEDEKADFDDVLVENVSEDVIDDC